MNEQERIWHLVARRLSDEASDEELQELQDLLRRHPELTYSLQVLSDLWKPGEQGNRTEAERAFLRHEERLQRYQQIATHEPLRLEPFTDNSKRSGWGNGMLGNAFKVSWRSLTRNRGFSGINILGLAIGMASALLILLWIAFQFSYDQFQTNKDRIYQVFTRATINGQIECWGSTPMVMGPVLQKEYPEVEQMARFNWVGAFVFSAGDRHLQTSGYITDPGFLKMMSFPLVKGNVETALSQEHSVVLTEKMARRLFGDADALGKLIRVDSNALFTVTGVLKDLPYNTRFYEFDYLIPWSYMKEVHWTNPSWDATTIQTLVMLKKGVTEQRGDAVLRNIVRAHDASLDRDVFLHPMPRWALHTSWENGVNTGGGIQFVRLFALIAGLILLIACINYMNLTTARSTRRAREVGIRKTIGAMKGSLILQFMGESIGISFVSGLLGLIILVPGLYAFNKYFDSHIAIPYGSPGFWLGLTVFMLLTGIIAGSYPAFYLSSFRPMQVLKGIFRGAHKLMTPRKVLVVLQFTVAIVMMICTIVIYRQIDYAQKRNVGYDRNRLSYVYIKGDIPRNYPLIRQALFNSGLVKSMARTNSPITDIWIWDESYVWPGKDTAAKYRFAGFQTYSDLVKTMGLTLTEGRDIDLDRFPGDTASVLLNETAARLMGLTMPLGHSITNREKSWRVVGVVKDFIPQSPYNAVPPIVCMGSRDRFGTLTFKLNEDADGEAGTEKIRAIFKKYNPDCPFEYYQVKKSYLFKFSYEQDFATLAAVFAGLAIFISCMGLFGLAASAAESRVKEIGVRKVFGASVSAITALLSKDFLKWVIMSFCLASPLAWWTMHGWLSNFSYHTSLSWWIFSLAGVLSVLIAGATVSYQAIRAALGSPAKALRTE